MLPGDLLSCPFHAVTGLWCPFCGGLRCVAALVRGDLPAALSSNVVVVGLLPLVVLGWLRVVGAAARGQASPGLRVGDRAWLVLLGVLSVFTVWRNLPGLPLAGYLAP